MLQYLHMQYLHHYLNRYLSLQTNVKLQNSVVSKGSYTQNVKLALHMSQIFMLFVEVALHADFKHFLDYRSFC